MIDEKNINFENLKLKPQILKALEYLQWEEPTEIQKTAIPKIKSGQDVIAVAQTGTGKTAAFAIPIISNLNYAQNHDPRALILSPTRELAIQIQEHIAALASFTSLRVVAIYGGIGFTIQTKKLNEGVDILIATPRRLLETYFRQNIILKNINTLVLDEADKMMDMGFLPQVRKVIDVIPKKRQNLLFSATFSPKVEQMVTEFLDFPVKINSTEKVVISDAIKQLYYPVPNFLTKIKLLEYLLHQKKYNRVIIFTRTKDIANNIYKFLNRKFDGSVRVIHSNKSQNARINAIQEFSSGNIKILVSTDIAARGIDINKISHVINFQLPFQKDEYIHRIGRTGRVNNNGIAISMVNPAEELMLKEIEKHINISIKQLFLPKEIDIVPTTKEEAKSINLHIDKIKRKQDPSFKGAFHKKKNYKAKQPKKKTN